MTTKKSDLFSEEATDNSEALSSDKKEISENKSEENTTILASEKTNSIILVLPEEKPILEKFFEEEQKVLEIVSICERAQEVKDDSSNDYARQVGKRANELVKAIDKKRLALTKPVREEQERINTVAKKLSSPIEAQIEKIRSVVTAYETEKERKRLEEVARIEKEKKEKEEKEKKERERVAKIKNEINRIQNTALADINQIEDMKSLNELEFRLNSWKPKAEFFSEFMPELQAVIKDLNEKITLRKPVIEQLQKQKEEAARLKGEAKKLAEEKLKLQQEELKKQKEAEEKRLLEEKELKDRAEALNRQELSIFIASLNYTKETAQEVEKFIGKYGSATTAMQKKQEMLDTINAERIAAAKNTELNAKKMKNQRVNFKFRILNESEVPREFLSVDEKKINQAIVANRMLLEKVPVEFKIAGIEIYSETKTVLK